MAARDKLKNPTVLILSFLVIVIAGWSVIFAGWSIMGAVFDDQGPLDGGTVSLTDTNPRYSDEGTEHMPKASPPDQAQEYQVLE